jgi:anti-sigma regulatory factor (Ser/Thr protein kinase)
MEKHTLEVAASMENMNAVMAFMEEHTKFIENLKTSYHLAIVTEELATNIFNYAYDGRAGKLAFSISNDPERRRVIMEFRDSGKEYNPLLQEDPDITGHVSERKIGGLGIMMAKKLSDEQGYVREGGQNVLTVIKKY